MSVGLEYLMGQISDSFCCTPAEVDINWEMLMMELFPETMGFEKLLAKRTPYTAV